MKILSAALCGLMLCSFPATARTMVDHQIAVIRLLDKATARVEQIELERNKPYLFGGIQVEMRSCQQTPPEEEPESAAWLAVRSVKAEDKEAVLFRGWMFASNPALSALEHPLYDVWVISCKKPATMAASAVSPAGNAVPVVVGGKPLVPAEGLPVAVPGYVPPMADPAPPPVEHPAEPKAAVKPH